ncbi:MAG TPA: type IV secretion protein Rhs [Cyanobacteria bacterium UBA11370]|nr:type IV secretion protein Rhs [Cyanobacteria bacterium UBA11370]
MNQFCDAFISYGRADSKAFATQLQGRLLEEGFKVWFDQNDIPLGVDFQNQIDDGIEKAHNFLFLIAPHSVNSPYCRKEIELALKRNKRIIPLLHVEQIPQETWQQRNPNGTPEEWEAYKLKGLHSSFPNMHPAIGKINWVYFREGIDDFEKSFVGLVNLIRSYADYVKNHTHFLTKALEWERHQKQTSCLLVGEEKHQAEAWLKIRFKDEQPPCIPSDLHCEYITESIKNANNLMTQVFLSYADKDRETMEKIRNSLRRESITVWTNKTDIQTGEAFEEAIKRGIEQADNLIYLLSPDAINSDYCQQELDLAVSLHKRIIPVLVQETSPEQIPNMLRQLQYIDLTDNVKEDDYLLDESQLLKILHEDAAYYSEHKILLTKALKWKQQHDNPSVLLRGYNLASAETWLKVALKRTQHPPTSLQKEFIEESLRQPPAESLDVFISYSRADADFARKLNDTLQIQGKTTWFDQESIASGSDFQQEINRGIKVCDNLLFILSPRSVNSPYCKDEVEYAASLNKRFVTVLYREINTADLHPELAKVQWIDFNQNEQDFNANFNQLVRTLDTDRIHVHSHTKWLQRAIEWKQNDKSADLLLRGSEFLIAQNWLQETEHQKKQPAATALQKEFIEASQNAIVVAEEAEKHRQAEMLRLQEERTKEAEARLAEQKKSAKRQKFFLVAVTMLLAAAVVGIVVALNQREKAKNATVVALNEKKNAEEAQAAQLNSVSRFSLVLSEGDLKFNALLEAIRVGSQLQKLRQKVNPETQSLILTALQAAVYGDGFREQNRLTKHTGTVFDVSFSADGNTMATASGDGTIKLWSLNGQELNTIPKVPNVKEGNYGVNGVSFSPDGTTIASANGDNTVKLWSKEGELLHNLNGHKAPVKSVVWSPDGNTLASTSEDNTVKLWSKQGKPLQTLTGYQKEVTSVSFSPDGKIIATAGRDGIIKLWNRNGQQFKPFKSFECCKEGVNSLSFSPDGTTIASANGDNTVKLWNKQGKPPETLTGHKASVSSVVWSSDGTTIASASLDNTVILWSKQGKPLQTLHGHEASIRSVRFSPDGETIATSSGDNTVILWSKSGKILKTLKAHNNAVWSVAWSPDGNILASASADNTIKLWTKQGRLIPTQMKHEDAISSVSFSPDGNTIASASKDKTVKLWNKEGKFLQSLNTQKEKDAVWSVAWSPDGNTIAYANGDNTIKLWSKQSNTLQTLSGHKATVWGVAWSPDGTTIASASGDKMVKLWSKQGKPLQTLVGHTGAIASVSFSPDSTILASASNDNTVKLWSQEGKLLKTLIGHQDDALGVTFSPDGTIIASTSKDHTVKLWDKVGNPLQTLIGHQQRVTSVSFSPDGKTLASASDDHTIILWNLADLQLDQLMQDACTQVEDYLKYNAPEGDKLLCEGIRTQK